MTILFILGFCFAGQGNLFAQVFGIKAGLNLSKFHFAEQPEPESVQSGLKPGFHVGAYAQLPMGKKVFFRPELQFSQRGANGKGTYPDVAIN